jgi:molecular chaperone GrpE
MSKKDDNKNLKVDNDTDSDADLAKETEEAGDKNEQDNGELEQLKEKLTEAENDYKRALADYQNLQKRVSDQRSELILSANRDLLLRILSVLDTLILANKHVDNEGLKVAINQFQDVLKAEGVVKIESEGQDFNPHMMECVVIEEGDENKVLEEMLAGYMLNDKVLRPAQVKVGKSEIQSSKHETN